MLVLMLCHGLAETWKTHFQTVSFLMEKPSLLSNSLRTKARLLEIPPPVAYATLQFVDRTRIFPEEEGHVILRGAKLLFHQIFPKTTWKWRKFGEIVAWRPLRITCPSSSGKILDPPLKLTAPRSMLWEGVGRAEEFADVEKEVAQTKIIIMPSQMRLKTS